MIINKVCVISSCSRGIGLEFTKNLLEKGNTVIGLCRNQSDKLSFLQSTYPQSFHLVSGVDIKNQESIDRMEIEVKNNFKRIDLLINVSGILSDDVNKPER